LAGFFGGGIRGGSLGLQGEEASPQPALGLTGVSVSPGPPERGLWAALQHLPQTAENQDGVPHQGERRADAAAAAGVGDGAKAVAMLRCRTGLAEPSRCCHHRGSSPLSWLSCCLRETCPRLPGSVLSLDKTWPRDQRRGDGRFWGGSGLLGGTWAGSWGATRSSKRPPALGCTSTPRYPRWAAMEEAVGFWSGEGLQGPRRGSSSRPSPALPCPDVWGLKQGQAGGRAGAAPSRESSWKTRRQTLAFLRHHEHGEGCWGFGLRGCPCRCTEEDGQRGGLFATVSKAEIK